MWSLRWPTAPHCLTCSHLTFFLGDNIGGFKPNPFEGLGGESEGSWDRKFHEFYILSWILYALLILLDTYMLSLYHIHKTLSLLTNSKNIVKINREWVKFDSSITQKVGEDFSLDITTCQYLFQHYSWVPSYWCNFCKCINYS